MEQGKHRPQRGRRHKKSMDSSSPQIIHYPHPTLRHHSKPIQRVDRGLRSIIGQMFRLMYESRGVGLAANQIDLPLRVFIANLAADPEEGEEHVFINPVISQPKGMSEQEEGCLSIPGINGNVRRPERVQFQAYTLDGQSIDMSLEGLFARVVQHELDHLDGVLFTDRLSETGKMAVRPELEELEVSFRSQCDTGLIPSDEAIRTRLNELEQRYG